MSDTEGSRRNPADVPDLESGLASASRLVEEGDAEGALGMLLALEPEHPTDATLLCMIGVVADHFGATGVAVDFYRRCLAEQPTEPEILVRVGAGLAAAGDPDAEPALRLAALTAPEMPEARLRYGALLIRSGMLAEGVSELRAAQSLKPDDAEIHREIAVAHLIAGREADAADELETAVDLAPDDPESRLLRGLLLIQRGEMEAAAEVMYPASSEFEDDGEVQGVLALTYAAAEWMDQAWLALSRAEAAADPADLELVREIEEALSDGGEQIQELVEETAGSMLRNRIYSG